MIIIPDFISEEYADSVVSDLDNLDWQAGHSLDPDYKEQVKNNLELHVNDDPIVEKHGNKILKEIFANVNLRDLILPYRGKVPQFNKYAEGGTYHWHSDSCYMGKPEIRTDFAITLFLNNADEYEGGELTLRYSDGEVRKTKQNKGTLICYPCAILHKVTPVTSGTRYAAVAWIQSMIRSPENRNIIADLNTVLYQIRKKEGLSEDYTNLFNVKNNLLRMWSEI